MNSLVRQARYIFLLALGGGVFCSLGLAWWASEAFPWEPVPHWERSFWEPMQHKLEWIRALLVNCQPIFTFLIFSPALTGLFFEIGLSATIFPGAYFRRHKREKIFHSLWQQKWATVSQVLNREGVEAALQYHRNAQEEDENQLLSIFLYVEVCQWVLPLMGFLGTVWGLHQAIGPLKVRGKPYDACPEQSTSPATPGTGDELFWGGICGIASGFRYHVCGPHLGCGGGVTVRETPEAGLSFVERPGPID